jgi:hypothetical protein
MNQRKLPIPVVIFLILGFYVCFFETGGEDKGKRPDRIEKALDIIPEDIQEIGLKRQNLRVVLENIDNGWRIKEPFEADANNSIVHDMLNVFEHGIVRVIDENPSDLKLFGLDNPRYELAIKDRKDQRPRRLLIGDDAPGNISCYAKVDGSPRVILIGVRYRQEFDRALDDFTRSAGDR